VQNIRYPVFIKKNNEQYIFIFFPLSTGLTMGLGEAGWKQKKTGQACGVTVRAGW
jgi:hypothetical protein